MKARFPMRVRCVNNTEPFKAEHLVVGKEYTAHGRDGEFFHINMGFGKERDPYFCERFKPVVRVKAKCIRVSWIEFRLQQAIETFESLTPEVKAEHMRRQRESWVRGEMALSAMGLG